MNFTLVKQLKVYLMLVAVLFNMLINFCLKIMDQNPKGLISIMILSGMFANENSRTINKSSADTKTQKQLNTKLPNLNCGATGT
jgi:hypothetical protein